MSAKIFLDIIKYQPEDNDLIFIVRTDDKSLDTTINYKERESINLDVTNFRKEIKFYFRVQKHGITQGSTDFSITQLNFVKRDELISKTLNVISMLKKDVIGKLLIRARISYTDSTSYLTNINNIKEVTRSSSALPLENRSATTRGSLTTYVNGATSNKHNPSYTSYFGSMGLNGSLTSFNTTKKNSTTTGKNGSLKANLHSSPNNIRFSTEKKKSSAGAGNFTKNISIADDLDKSRIETLFDDDKIGGIENVGKNLQEFISEFRARYKEKFEENPEDKTQEGFHKIIDQLFELQEIYYDDYGKASSLNNILRSYLLSYCENFRYSNKKNNRLNEMLETIAIKKEFSDILNRQDNERIGESIDIHKKELKIYKNIFKLKYDQDLVEKYKEEMKSEKYENYKSSLLQSIQEIASNPKKWEKLDEKKKEDFFNIARKYNVKVKTKEDIEEEEREKERQKQEELEKERERQRELEKERQANMKGLRIEISQNPNCVGERSNNFNQISIVTANNPNNALHNVTTDPNDKKVPTRNQRKRLTIVESENADSNDTKLDQSLINIYNKKRMSFIPVKKLGEDNYEFGSQKIQIKIDGDIIRVKSASGYILLDKFVDIYGPIEENIMIQAHFPQEAGKNGVGINISASPSQQLKKK